MFTHHHFPRRFFPARYFSGFGAGATAIVVSVAEAVWSQLAAASLSQDISPLRSYADWELALEDTNALHVDVVPVTTAQEADASSRGTLQYTVPIDIAVRKKVSVVSGRADVAEVDPLMLLVQDIHELFSIAEMEDFAPATWQETKILAAPVRQHLREFNQFTGIVRVTFRADRSIS